MMRLTVFSERLPVSGSTWLSSSWFRPRRRSDWVAHCPSESAVTLYGSRPGVATDTDALGAEVPRSRYDVEVSSTSSTATDGSVTAIVGGLAKRSSWTDRYTPNATTK